MTADFEIVVIGSSTGGLKALQTLLSGLDADFSLPLVIVQHRGRNSDDGLCEFLAQSAALPILEPEDKERIQARHIYLAPRDYHLLIENQAFALSVDYPVSYARPSINVLFESAADEYQEKLIGIVLTGANHDGAAGLATIGSHGGVTIVEDPDSAASSEMPRAALARVRPDWVLPIDKIAGCLNGLANKLALPYGN